jgi:hypothetical protein
MTPVTHPGNKIKIPLDEEAAIKAFFKVISQASAVLLFLKAAPHTRPPRRR